MSAAKAQHKNFSVYEYSLVNANNETIERLLRKLQIYIKSVALLSSIYFWFHLLEVHSCQCFFVGIKISGLFPWLVSGYNNCAQNWYDHKQARFLANETSVSLTIKNLSLHWKFINFLLLWKLTVIFSANLIS